MITVKFPLISMARALPKPLVLLLSLVSTVLAILDTVVTEKLALILMSAHSVFVTLTPLVPTQMVVTLAHVNKDILEMERMFVNPEIIVSILSLSMARVLPKPLVFPLSLVSTVLAILDTAVMEKLALILMSAHSVFATLTPLVPTQMVVTLARVNKDILEMERMFANLEIIVSILSLSMARVLPKLLVFLLSLVSTVRVILDTVVTEKPALMLMSVL